MNKEWEFYFVIEYNRWIVFFGYEIEYWEIIEMVILMEV